jgi:hypothetical protein
LARRVRRARQVVRTASTPGSPARRDHPARELGDARRRSAARGAGLTALRRSRPGPARTTPCRAIGGGAGGEQEGILQRDPAQRRGERIHRGASPVPVRRSRERRYSATDAATDAAIASCPAAPDSQPASAAFVPNPTRPARPA